MLYSLLLTLLVVATLALFTIGALLAHQQRMEAEDRSPANDANDVVRLGELSGSLSNNGPRAEDHAVAKLKLEMEATQRMADIIG